MPRWPVKPDVANATNTTTNNKSSAGKKRKAEEAVDQWVQCAGCDQWRRYPEWVKLPRTKWMCHMNTWNKYNSCDVPEESGEETVTFLDHSDDTTAGGDDMVVVGDAEADVASAEEDGSGSLDNTVRTTKPAAAPTPAPAPVRKVVAAAVPAAPVKSASAKCVKCSLMFASAGSLQAHVCGAKKQKKSEPSPAGPAAASGKAPKALVPGQKLVPKAAKSAAAAQQQLQLKKKKKKLAKTPLPMPRTSSDSPKSVSSAFDMLLMVSQHCLFTGGPEDFTLTV